MEEITPQPGPQTDFLGTQADIAIFGGSAGAGKSYALLLEPLRWIDEPHFGAVIFRRTTKQVRNEGGLWDTGISLYAPLGAEPKSSTLEFVFESGMRVRFAHLEFEKNVYDWQGSQIPLIGFDELTHFTANQFWYLLSRNRSTTGIPGYIRATCNADADSWVRQFIDWWINPNTGYPVPERAGILRYFVRIDDKLHWANASEELTAKFGIESMPKSVTFIPGKLEDNKILMEVDPTYQANLNALPLVERMRLKDGNWNVKAAAGMFFKREWFEVVDALPSAKSSIRYWDRACLIAGTEVITEHGLKSIEDIKAGEKVLTRQGMKKVTWSGLSKYTNKLVSVIFSNGKVLTGTSDHPVYTFNRGWIDLCELKLSDRVFSLTEESIHYTGIRDISIATNGTKRKKGMSTGPFIETYGKTSTVQYPLVFISTTKTETGLTTRLKILNAFPEKPTHKNTSMSCRTKLISKIQGIEKKHLKLFAKGRNSSNRTLVRPALKDSTPKVSKPSIVNHAKFVDVPVYDLSVEDCHEFFANSILVHNSSQPSSKYPDPDYTVGMKLIRDAHGIFYVADICRMQDSPHKVEQAILNCAKQDGQNTQVHLEQDPGQAGVVEVKNYSRLLAGYDVRFTKVHQDKKTRARGASAQAEAGNIKLIRAPWNEDLLKELSSFPESKHDDIVDALSGSMNTLIGNTTGDFIDSMIADPTLTESSLDLQW